MIEILQNIKYQIESSGENIGRIVFTGGGSKLKNISAIIEDNLPNYRIRIATDIEMGFTHSDELPITTGAITPTLFGLLSKGEENCCEEEITAPKDAVIQNDLFEKEKKEDEIEKPVKKEDDKKEGISEITGKENQKLNKKFYHLTQDYLFVHAGIDPRYSLEEQSEVDLVYIRSAFYRNKHNLKQKVINRESSDNFITIEKCLSGEYF